MNKENLRRLMTTAETAVYTGLAESTLEQSRVTGKLGLPFVKIGRSVFYDKADVDSWIESKKRTSTSEVV